MPYKVGYIFFHGLGEKLELNFSYDFGNGVKFKRQIPSIADVTWHKWLGLQWEDVVASNGIIEVKVETEHPEVLDGENAKLEFECRLLWVSLMLTGSFYLDNAYFLTGSEIDNKVEIRQFYKFDNWVDPGDDFIREVTDAEMGKWKVIFQQIKKVYAQNEKFLRFKRGINCFFKGCSESEVSFRLPYFVRSLEALIIPDIGNTTKQFRERVAKWWKDKKEDNYFSENVGKALFEIYDMRCKFEHMHDLEIDLVNRQLLRSYQCEEIVRNAYHAILSSEAELDIFSEDSTIRKYWGR